MLCFASRKNQVEMRVSPKNHDNSTHVLYTIFYMHQSHRSRSVSGSPPQRKDKRKVKRLTSLQDDTTDRSSSLLDLQINANQHTTYFCQAMAWNLDGKPAPVNLVGLDLRYGCDVYAFQLTNCCNVHEFETSIREILGDNKEYTSYIKSMGKSPNITCLLVFASTALILARNWQCLDGSVKSKKWEIRRGSKNMFGKKSSEYGAIGLAFVFKKHIHLAFVAVNLSPYKNETGNLEEIDLDAKRSHDINRILTKLPFELTRRRSTQQEGTLGEKKKNSSSSHNKKSKNKNIAIDHVIMFGSLHYPMETTKLETLSQASKATEEGRQQQWVVLTRRDMLTKALKRDPVYRGFEESSIQCLPTSPKIRATETKSTSSSPSSPSSPSSSSSLSPTTADSIENKSREDIVDALMAQYGDAPSYPDRILHQSTPTLADQITCVEYGGRTVLHTIGPHDPMVGLLQILVKQDIKSDVSSWARMSGNTPRSLLSPSPMSSTIGMDPFFRATLMRSASSMPMQGYWQTKSGNIDPRYMSFWSPESLIQMPFFSLVRPYLDGDDILTVFARLFELKTYHEGGK